MRKALFIVASTLLTSTLVAQQKPLFSVDTKFDSTGKETYEEVRSLILDKYYYDGITESDLYWASLSGMLRHVSPPQSPNLAKLWTKEEYDKILNSLKGVKVTMGFGSTFNTNDGSLTVTSLTEGTKAAELLKIQDRILRIDNQSLKGLTLATVNELLDGTVGQTSKLKVVRDIKVFDIKLTRDSLKAENLIVTKIPNSKRAYVHLKTFSIGISQDLEAELIKLEEDSVNTIILDLRNNAGGVLNEGMNVAGLFLKNRNIVVRTQARSEEVKNFTATEDKFTDLNVVVLMNEITASASEIVVAALQDHSRAITVGKKSYGKAVIEHTYTLDNGYRVKFISNAMYSPRGVSWQGVGLLPDYFVEQTPAAYQNSTKMSIEERVKSDIHLITALKLLDK